MVKVIVFVLVVSGCTFLGWLFSAKYRKRRQFFTQLLKFNARLQSELSFSRLSILSFLEKYEYSGEFAQFLAGYRTGLELGTMEIDLPFLSKEEEQLLLDYFLSLGKSDAGTQLQLLGGYEKRFAALSQEVAAESSRYETLYLKLGLLFGLLVVILLV